jgi:hypothetical protein
MKVDFSLNEPKSVRMQANENTPWPILDFSPTKPTIVTPAAQTLATARRGEAYYPAGTNHAPRQTLLKGQFQDDSYMSDADKGFVSSHGGILRTDCYAGSAEESDAVFSGGGIKHTKYQTTDVRYDGNLSELVASVTESILAGNYDNPSLLTEDEPHSREELIASMAEGVVALSEHHGGISPEDIVYAMYTCLENKGVSLGNFLQTLQQFTRETRVSEATEMLRGFWEAVGKEVKLAKSRITGDNPKTKKPKTGDGITGSAAHVIAVASSGVVGGKKRKPNASVGNGVMSEQVIVSPRLKRLLKG